MEARWEIPLIDQEMCSLTKVFTECPMGVPLVSSSQVPEIKTEFQYNTYNYLLLKGLSANLKGILLLLRMEHRHKILYFYILDIYLYLY